MPKRNLTQMEQKNHFLASNPIFADYFKEQNKAKRPISTTIKKTVGEVTALLNNISNFPLFFEYLEKVELTSGSKSQWYFKNSSEGGKGLQVPMHFEMIKGEGFLWKSEDAAGLPYSVAIQVFEAQAGRGSVVQMMTAYDSVVGDVVGIFEGLFGASAEISSKKNLQRFKAFCETGHVPTTEGQSSGRDEDLEKSTKH